MRSLIFGTGLVLATLSTQASAPNNEAWQQAEAKITVCFQAMDRDPALVVVNAKFARRDPTPAQLADKTVPSDEESAALRLRVNKTKPCRELRLSAVRAHHPLLEPAYETLYYQADQVFDYLQQQAIGYGTANRLSAEALDFFKAREHLYFQAPADEKAALSNVWREQLQAAHSNPAPTPERVCSWEGLNIACH